MAGIVLSHVTKRYDGDVIAVDDASLEIHDGEFVVLVGPSGCGKSTLLRMIAGLEDVTQGSIEIGGRDVTDLAPRHRDIAMVFQSYALYPHMSVRDNLGYGLKVRRTPKADIRRRVDEVAALLGLTELLSRRPAALSGGQRQRVAMGRAIVREPRAFLMDEPLSNLDAKLRVDMRASLAQLHDRLGVTTVYVTHDQVEAMTLGRRVAVMRAGRILQVDSPQRLYHEPRNLFVAAFIGSPTMNLVEAKLDEGMLTFGQYRIQLPALRTPKPPTARLVVGIRPEYFEDASLAQPGKPTIEVEPTVVEELGSEVHALFPIDAAPVSVESVDSAPGAASLLAQAQSLFTARLDARTKAKPFARISLAVDPDRFHYFDPETGENLLASDGGRTAHATQHPELAAR